MKSSKLTTWCGAIGIVAGVVVATNFSPLITKIAGCFMAAANGLGLFFARDNGVSDERAGAVSSGAAVASGGSPQAKS